MFLLPLLISFHMWCKDTYGNLYQIIGKKIFGMTILQINIISKHYSSKIMTSLQVCYTKILCFNNLPLWYFNISQRKEHKHKWHHQKQMGFWNTPFLGKIWHTQVNFDSSMSEHLKSVFRTLDQMVVLHCSIQNCLYGIIASFKEEKLYLYGVWV